MPCTPSPWLEIPGVVPIEVDGGGVLQLDESSPRGMLLCGGNDGFIEVFMPPRPDSRDDEQDQWIIAAAEDVVEIQVKDPDLDAPADILVIMAPDDAYTFVLTSNTRPDPEVYTVWEFGEIDSFPS